LCSNFNAESCFDRAFNGVIQMDEELLSVWLTPPPLQKLMVTAHSEKKHMFSAFWARAFAQADHHWNVYLFWVMEPGARRCWPTFSDHFSHQFG
jgi:hypothetical protein